MSYVQQLKNRGLSYAGNNGNFLAFQEGQKIKLSMAEEILLVLSSAKSNKSFLMWNDFEYYL